MPQPEVHPKDTWSSLAMKHYGDALLGMRLAEANGVNVKVPPIEVGSVHFPPVEELDPDRLKLGPAPGSDMFADDEASVVKEARYRMVMAMGGSGAVNEAPAAISSRPVKKVDKKTRKQRIEEAKEKRVDLLESLGEADGQALILDVKPTRRPREGEKKKKPSTKDNLAKQLAQNDGKDLILELKPGQRREPEDDDERHMGDALAEQDGKAMILEVHATRRKKKKKKKKKDGSNAVEEEEVKRGERFGDKLAQLDGKAMILDVRASTQREETEEQKAAKKKNKATAKLFADLADRDGKELILDLNVQAKDEKKIERLKEKRRLAKKRKRRTGSGSLIPKEWKAEGRVSSDDVDDYLDELREQRAFESEYFGEDTDASTNPIAKSARATHHRSAKTRRSTAVDPLDVDGKRSETEGFGAFDDIQHRGLQPAAGRRRPTPRKAEAPEFDEPMDEDALLAARAAELFGEIENTATTPGQEHTAPSGPVAQELPPDQVLEAVEPAPTPVAEDLAPRRADKKTSEREAHPRRPRRPPPPEAEKKNPARRVPPRPGAAATPGRRASGPAAPQARARSAPQRGPRAPAAPIARPERPAPPADDWSDPPEPSIAGAQSDWDDESAGLSGLSGLSGISRTGAASGPLPSVSADDPYAPEVMARLCMLSPGVVMQVARSAPVGAGPVLQLIGNLREAKNEGTQADLMRRFLGEHQAEARRTLELLLTT